MGRGVWRACRACSSCVLLLLVMRDRSAAAIPAWAYVVRMQPLDA